MPPAWRVCSLSERGRTINRIKTEKDVIHEGAPQFFQWGAIEFQEVLALCDPTHTRCYVPHN